MRKKILALFLVLCLALCGCEITIVYETESQPQTVTNGDTLTVHFIDVGQADCALLECGGEYMLIDGGNVEDGQLVVSYLQEQGVEQLNMVVCTHAHEDHVGGLPSVLAVYPTHTVLSPTKTYASKVFDDFMYYVDQQGLEVEIPSPGDSYNLGDDESGATVTVLGPVKSYAETNDTSIVLRVEFGDNSFLFTGDMEVPAENDILDYWDNQWERADVLKVGHHGSETSTGYRFLHEVFPTYAIISVGEGNTYGHPNDAPLSRLNNAGCTIFRTDKLGTILATSDGTDITFTWENQSAEPSNAERASATFIGNKHSKKFHTGDCPSLPSAQNQVVFDSYWEAVEAGYAPCGSCLE